MTRALALALALSSASCAVVSSGGGKLKDRRVMAYGAAGDLLVVGIPVGYAAMDSEEDDAAKAAKIFAVGSLILIAADLLVYSLLR